MARLSKRLFKNVDGKSVVWRHMEGSEGSKFGRDGLRYFAISLDDEFAEELEAEGWPVLWKTYENELDNGEVEEVTKPFLKIFLKFGTRYPCDVYLVNVKNQTKTALTEQDLNDLNIDSKTIESIDVLVRPYYWTFNDSHGLKCQVHSMNIVLEQDGLEDDYEIV